MNIDILINPEFGKINISKDPKSKFAKNKFCPWKRAERAWRPAHKISPNGAARFVMENLKRQLEASTEKLIAGNSNRLAR